MLSKKNIICPENLLKLAKTKGRPTATVTKDPSFAKQDPKDLLPRRYNPETGKMDIV